MMLSTISNDEAVERFRISGVVYAASAHKLIVWKIARSPDSMLWEVHIAHVGANVRLASIPTVPYSDHAELKTKVRLLA